MCTADLPMYVVSIEACTTPAQSYSEVERRLTTGGGGGGDPGDGRGSGDGGTGTTAVLA